ncbi:cupin domain-containing protein [uncultured Paraburkholderia sp.]|uniref:cupin domain-containing protein n=1 Tax=uncultured Paraburkholderia sp. TaxID=1822466 RepID=UPI002598595F|nr:cupin domain-containing protein [uncultured Paraburkholderia sp.]
MKKPVVYRNGGDTQFSNWTDVAAPIGDLVSQTRTANDARMDEEGVAFGIWECSRGVWRRQVTKREFSHILAGHCFFTPEGQSAVELRAGDSVYFPANCSGTWDVREDIRKSYLIID